MCSRLNLIEYQDSTFWDLFSSHNMYIPCKHIQNMPRSFEEVQQNQLSEFIYDEAATFRCPSEPHFPSLPTPAPVLKKV